MSCEGVHEVQFGRTKAICRRCETEWQITGDQRPESGRPWPIEGQPPLLELMAGEPRRPLWDEYFLTIAWAVARRADCRRARHGCVIVKNHRIVATGYNGSPSKGPSCLAGKCERGLLSVDELGHLSADYSNCISLHAEQNAIAYAAGQETRGATAYLTGPPCNMCGKLLEAAGIERVVYPT